MSIPGLQVINIGLPNESANSDSLYTAFTKANVNFTTLFNSASPFNTFNAGEGIGVTANANTGTVTITNAGVTNIIAGTNIVINQSNGNVTISATSGGSGGGTVTSVGLAPISSSRLTVSGSPIVSSGVINIDLATSGATAGTYSNPNITVDAYGRVTSIANGSIAGTVTSVGLVPGAGIQVSGGPITSNGNITVTNTGVTRLNAGAGILLSSGNGNVTISANTSSGTVTSIGVTSSQLLVTGSPVVTSGTIGINLPNNVTFTGNVNAGANVVANRVIANAGTINGNLTVTGNISPAAANKVGGIKPGPGVNVSLDGELTIDGANLPINFGNFTADNNVLSIVNVDEDMILQTEGNAEIQLVGDIGFYKPNVIPPAIQDRYFSATGDGQIKILVSNVDPTSAAVNIIGSTSGDFSPPVNNGVMLQLTGQLNTPSRFYNDGIGSFAAFVGRRINGTVNSPTAIQAGDELIRISSTGYNGTTVSGNGTARIVFQAMENFTAANTGSNLSFWTAAIGSNTLTKIATIDNANGLVATKVVSTGNANVGNLGTTGLITATGNVSGGNLTTGGALSVTGNATVGNLLSSGTITSNSATAGVGYRTGAGGTVTQLTDKSTAVTLNTITGEITMSNAQLSGDSTVSFTLNNSTIANTDVIIINQVSTANRGEYAFNGSCNTGNAVISVHNMTNTNRSDAIVLRYAVIKAATS